MKRIFLFLACGVSFVLNGLFFYSLGESLGLPQISMPKSFGGLVFVVALGGLLFVVGGSVFDGLKSYAPNQMRAYFNDKQYLTSFLWFTGWLMYLAFSVVATKSAFDGFIDSAKYNTPQHKAKKMEIAPLEAALAFNMSKLNDPELTAKDARAITLDNAEYRRNLSKLNAELHALPMADTFIVKNGGVAGWAVGIGLEYSIFLLSFSMATIGRRKAKKGSGKKVDLLDFETTEQDFVNTANLSGDAATASIASQKQVKYKAETDDEILALLKAGLIQPTVHFMRKDLGIGKSKADRILKIYNPVQQHKAGNVIEFKTLQSAND